jgi:2-polyprenyl-3-methyl-5-hydroxy-6-metoxy-1,4-benzoquinol methylase
MIPSNRRMEALLQKIRFQKVLPYLKGDVLDFGGNDGELKQFVNGNYTLVNYDHTPMKGKSFDTIVALAVVEHIEVKDVYLIFKELESKLRPGGVIFLTTPTPLSKPILEFMAFINILDKENIREHKHYWTRKEIYDLAAKSSLQVKRYTRFQLGVNQLAVLEKNK